MLKFHISNKECQAQITKSLFHQISAALGKFFNEVDLNLAEHTKKEKITYEMKNENKTHKQSP